MKNKTILSLTLVAFFMIAISPQVFAKDKTQTISVNLNDEKNSVAMPAQDRSWFQDMEDMQNLIYRMVHGFSDFNQDLGMRGGMDYQVYPQDNHYLVQVDLPGVGKENIELEVKDDYLLLKAERESKWEKQRSDENNFYQQSYQYGSFQKAIRLPENADTQKIEAEYIDGVLEVKIPLKEVKEEKGRTIAIK